MRKRKKKANQLLYLQIAFFFFKNIPLTLVCLFVIAFLSFLFYSVPLFILQLASIITQTNPILQHSIFIYCILYRIYTPHLPTHSTHSLSHSHPHSHTYTYTLPYFIYLSIYISIFLSIYISIFLYIYSSIYISTHKFTNLQKIQAYIYMYKNQSIKHQSIETIQIIQ
ncbi:hypothetical protein F4703DRAFT_1528273 [Phycomyces blakesleeanus]